jgi:hypothetical protein
MQTPPPAAPLSPVCPGAPAVNPAARLARPVDLNASFASAADPRQLNFASPLPAAIFSSTPSVGVRNLRASLGITQETIDRARAARANIERA